MSELAMSKEREGRFATNSGIEVKRIYTPEDIADLNYEIDLGLSGDEPFTRGIYPTMYRGRLWTIRQFSGLNTAEDTNKRFKYMYREGITGFSIAFDNATLASIDPDDPGAEFEMGTGGVNCFSLKDMEEMFDGIPIDKVSTAVIPVMWSTCQTTGMYFAMAEKRGIDLKKLDGTTEGDPLSTAACIIPPTDPVPFPHSFRLCVDLAEWCAINAPKWHPISFTSYNYREAGVNAYQEIAGLIASAIAVIEEELKRDRGLGVDDLVPHFTFHLASHSDFFEEIAKMRAARRMWHKIMTERYKAKDPQSKMLRFHIQTSGSTLTYQQPLNNAVRAAYQILAAALGGAQSMHACSYDEALCIPTEESVLLSVRTQQIAQHETNVTNVVDPLGGSYYVEWLTNEMEKKIWEYLGKIEEQGGFVKAVESGWFRGEVEKAEAEREREVQSGERKVVGVNLFKAAEEPFKVSFFRRDPQIVEKQRVKLQKLRQERDNRQVEEALEELRKVTESGENVMPAVMKALKAYATTGEISKVWKSIFGSYTLSGRAITA
jgi:methylmalonyl-CoA mutase N-terminal domain/subunit